MALGYERTFKTMRRGDARRHAADLGIPAAVRDAVAAPMRIGLVLLGEDYLRACALPGDSAVGGPVVAVVGSNGARLLPGAITAAITGEDDTRRFGAGYVALKGEIGARALKLARPQPGSGRPPGPRRFSDPDGIGASCKRVTAHCRVRREAVARTRAGGLSHCASYEYRTEVLAHGVMGRKEDELDRAELDKRLNALGADGWELEKLLTRMALHGEKDGHVLIFKRERL